MSTFKVALAVMGYDSGILADEHMPALDYKQEYDAPDFARKRTDPTIWLKDSIVWYSQQLTRKLGRAAFADYVRKFGYGNHDVEGIPGGEDGLTHAWLMSSLKISPDEQADFIRRLRLHKLPVSSKAYDMTDRIMPTFAAGGWTVHGKTGSGYLRNARGDVDRTRPLAWFVGWAEKDGREIVFARLRIGVKKSNGLPSLLLRSDFLKELPNLVEK
jgi:beta-lactamase class D